MAISTHCETVNIIAYRSTWVIIALVYWPAGPNSNTKVPLCRKVVTSSLYHGYGVFPLYINCAITTDTPMGGAYKTLRVNKLLNTKVISTFVSDFHNLFFLNKDNTFFNWNKNGSLI